jgi:hypothetical protein
MADGFVPPQEVRNNAKRGLELRKEHGRGGTEVGVARARDLSNGKALSLETINRMISYFARHEVDKKGEGWGKDSAGYIAWLLWGGDAGRAWATRVKREQENKEKSTMTDLTTSFFGIEKADKHADGTLTVYGKATDDALDIDKQICDSDWLDRAMPHWFKSGGNIREQHSNIAAGVAKEYELKADGHYITALVVDPVSVKKVENGVLKGFSIGIKNPRVIQDSKAANGRIVDGQIVEVSLVDRPANPNCQLVLAKSASGEETIVQVEELIEKKEQENFTDVIKPRKGEPADKELYNRVKNEAKAKFDVYPSAYANAWVVNEYKKRGGKYKAESEKKGLQSEGTFTEEIDMASETVAIPKSLLSDLVKFDKAEYEAARNALANLISIEAEGMKEGHNEIVSISHLLESVAHLHAWYEGEEAEGEVMEEMIELSAHTDKEMMPKKGETQKDYMKRCKEAGMDDETIKAMCDKYMGAYKSADVFKCLECGCNVPQDTHGRSDVSTATMISPSETPKSAEADEVVVEETTEETTEETPAVEETPAEEAPVVEEVTEEAPKVSAEDISDAEVEAIVEEAIKSATKSIKSEVALLVSAKEAALNKVTSLESELAIAKSLAVAGGPKRTGTSQAQPNDLLVKAATYKAKAEATTDPVLAKGYKELAKEYFAKSAEASK